MGFLLPGGGGGFGRRGGQGFFGWFVFFLGGKFCLG